MNKEEPMFKEKFKKYIKCHGQDNEKMEEVTELFEGLVCEEVKFAMPVVYEKFMKEFNELLDDITDEDVKEAVSYLHKKDGTTGHKWTLEETKSVMSQFNIHEKAGRKVSEIEFWFGMNYAYASHYTPNKPVSYYIELAFDEIFDKNVCFNTKVKHLLEKHRKHEEEII
jgi:hypothetical protein